jgi:hypothetical protein
MMTLALAACSESVDQVASLQPSSGSMASDAPMRTGSPEDENACLSAVASQTGNTVVVLSSEFSEANTLVMVGVGPQQAPWCCLVSKGRVAEVMSMTDEGAL